MITRNLKVILPTKKPLSLDAIKKHDKAKSTGKTENKLSFFLVKLN